LCCRVRSRCVGSRAAQLALGPGELCSELGRKSFAEPCQVLPDLWQLGAHGFVVNFEDVVERACRKL
jgi:hypothetical protein